VSRGPRPVVLNQLGDEASALIADSALPVEVVDASRALAWTQAG
jgi:hypothetical protein